MRLDGQGDDSLSVLIKVGGSLGEQAAPLIRPLQNLQNQSRSFVIVHGGGPRINAALEAAGMKLPFHNGLRRTHSQAMVIVDAVLGFSVNSEWVSLLRANGIAAVPVHGAKSGLFLAESYEGDHTADWVEAYAGPLEAAFVRHEIPVVAPIGHNSRGQRMNINADAAAAALAGSLQVEKLVFCTNVSGIYLNFPYGDRIDSITDKKLERLYQQGMFEGGMRPKVEAVLNALRYKVNAVYVVDGENEAAIEWAFANHPEEPVSGALGTRITRYLNE
ncbi:acetylglutamate kinase [Alicyclobacillus sp. TC]|nr:acetylglutamate kinase [Alicyclobacillus sp. TC]